MPKPIQITIPKPCTQSWDEMTPTGQGRHCAHCQKTVTDFTQWSDTALYDFFLKNKEVKLCGRFKAEQVNRDIIPYQPHSRLYQLFVGFGLTLMFIQPGELLAQQSIGNYTTGNSQVSGHIVDENGKTVFANVMLVKNINSVRLFTDANGYFAFKGVDSGVYELIVFARKYLSVPNKIIEVNDKDTLNVDIQLQLNPDSNKWIPDVTITGQVSPKMIKKLIKKDKRYKEIYKKD